MAKQFSMGSPEYVAQFYGGDKQRIFQALQTGALATIAPPPYDQTVAIAAAAHIDRMNAAKAQAQGGANPPTVAEQVMGGASPTPPVPTPPAGGLGATPQAAPPMAPMAPPMPAPEGAPMGMADGGLVGIPVPETMFDEPDNGGYAGGGLVAFAGGGDVPSFAGGDTVRDPLSWLHAPITSLYGTKRSTGAHQGQDFGVGKDTPIGVPAPGKVVTAATDDINGNFVVIEHPDGTRSSYSHLSAFNVKPGQVVDAGEVIGLSGNTGRVRGKGGGYHLHFGARDAEGNRINPTDFFNRIAPQTASGKFRQAVPERDIGTAGGARRASGSSSTASTTIDALAPPTDTLESGIPAAFKAAEDYYTKNMPERKNEGLGLLAEAARKTLDPAEREARRKEDMWMTLAEIGFNMASSNSPYLLQAASAAAAAALPGARAAKKEREAEKREAIRDLAAAEDITYKQAAEKTKFITDFAGMQLGLKKDDLARATNIWERMFSEAAATERTGMQIAEQTAANAGTGGLSPAQATERLRMLENQYEAAVEKALTQDSENALGAVEQSLAEAGRIQSMYNAIARRTGMPPLPSLNGKAFTNFNSYYKENKATPLGTVYGSRGNTSGGQRADPLGIR